MQVILKKKLIIFFLYLRLVVACYFVGYSLYRFCILCILVGLFSALKRIVCVIGGKKTPLFLGVVLKNLEMKFEIVL